MDLAAVAGITFGFIGMVFVGWLLRRTGVLTHDDARPLNAIIIYVGLPAFILRSIQGAVLDWNVLLVAVVAWLVFGGSALVAWLASRLMKLPRPVAGGFILAAAFGNTGYLGYPISLALLGEEGLVHAIFYDVFGTVGAVLAAGLFIAARFGEAKEERVQPIKEVLTFPAVIALVAALALGGAEIPVLVGNWLDAFAKLVTPLIMISIGLSLRMGSIREYLAPLLALSGIRLVFAPLVALGLGLLAFRDPAAVNLVVMQAGMPSMMLTIAIGARFGLDTGFIAGAILMTTVLSVVSIPAVQLLIG